MSSVTERRLEWSGEASKSRDLSMSVVSLPLVEMREG